MRHHVQPLVGDCIVGKDLELRNRRTDLRARFLVDIVGVVRLVALALHLEHRWSLLYLCQLVHIGCGS